MRDRERERERERVSEYRHFRNEIKNTEVTKEDLNQIYNEQQQEDYNGL